MTSLLLVIASGGAKAQTTVPPAQRTAPDTAQAGAVRVYLDCQSARCDFDFFRDQMRWVNFVRDRLVSDVLLLVTSLRTGSGGFEYTIAAIGQTGNRGRADTAVMFVAPNDADDVVRRQLARTFALLLGPYAARTPLASRLTLTYAAPSTASASPKSVKDPWDFWVYRVSVNGFGNGEKRQSFVNGFATTSANRVTQSLKVNLSANLGYDQSRFDLGDGKTFTNIQRNYGANALMVKSISDHLSAGITANSQFSDFNNYDLNLRVTPAVEYNVFPYKDFTRRQLTAFYAIGVASMRYQDITIFDRTAETRPIHNFTVAWTARQPWGSVNMGVYGSQYLHDLSLNSYGISGFTDLRIAKGLAINVGGNYSRVNDQLYLRRGALSDNQVIARQQALATNYRFFMNLGMSYTFGSIFNTVVNPRFGGGRGGQQF
ncbi:hypothetical protein [Gemmatimonas sp.]|uniref:hypothetical protein n=1 Tax=Gemmatimonas sp. TaxID=1962908 RepID=UPI003561C087